MILGVDASNIRGGGTVNHLVELLRAAEPRAHGFSRVVVWSGRATLDRVEERPWLDKQHRAALDGGLVSRSAWQRFRLTDEARRARCDVLFVPGGSFAGDFRPMVAMSQNLLPFEWRELLRFGASWMTVKLTLLRAANTRTFRRADGLILLTGYARDAVMRVVKATAAEVAVIPLGIGARFSRPPRDQHPIGRYAGDRPFRFLYVSTIDMYKHQPEVAEAVARLRRDGFPVALDLVGPAYAPALERLRATLRRLDPAGEYIRYVGAVPPEALGDRYAAADACVFASSCENMPNILLEGMAAGLPIACSTRGPMPEMLGDGGVYFDPERPADIARALRALIESPELRAEKAVGAAKRSRGYSWERCARDTFAFLSTIATRRSR